MQRSRGAPCVMREMSFTQRETEKSSQHLRGKNWEECEPVTNEAERKAQGSREAATQNFHGHAGKPRERCEPAPAYFPVSIALASAQSEINPIKMSLSSHHVSIIVTNKGAAKRRHKTSTGMRERCAKDVGPLQHTSRARVAFESAHSVRKVFEMCLRPHRLTQKGKQKGCAFEKCTTQVSTGAAPRPLERRPVPEGRNSGWWRQPERLFERA